MLRVLVTGGAGFIGSHMMKRLTLNGYEAVALDDLSTGHADFVKYGELVIGDFGDKCFLRKFLRQNKFDAVMHFAGRIEVSLSVSNPRVFYDSNVGSTLSLIGEVIDADIKNFIFSSSAAVYGSPAVFPIREVTDCSPMNPYGRTKSMIESALNDYRAAYGLNCTSLRYFNAAGADLDGEMGELHEPETHLIPLAIRSALGLSGGIQCYGEDYDTADGTCIRDYVHVNDICDAHLLALKDLLNGSSGRSYNLGMGRGYSVKEIIATVERIVGNRVDVEFVERREGDPAVLVADPTLAVSELGWRPVNDLDVIVSSAVGFLRSRFS